MKTESVSHVQILVSSLHFDTPIFGLFLCLSGVLGHHISQSPDHFLSSNRFYLITVMLGIVDIRHIIYLFRLFLFLLDLPFRLFDCILAALIFTYLRKVVHHLHGCFHIAVFIQQFFVDNVFFCPTFYYIVGEMLVLFLLADLKQGLPLFYPAHGVSDLLFIQINGLK